MELGLFTCGYQYESIEAAFADAAAFGCGVGGPTHGRRT